MLAEPLVGLTRVERMRKRVVLPPPFGPEQAEDLARRDPERNAIEREPFAVAMA